MKKIAMISQPMGDKTEQEILQTKEKAVAALTEKGYGVINTYFCIAEIDIELGRIENVPLYCLAKSLENMSNCQVVYFCKGWEKARGCRIEYEAAKAYGLDMIYEQED